MTNLTNAIAYTQLSEIEIDSNSEINAIMGGMTYRVWHSYHLLGTFHQSPADHKWLAHPVFGRNYSRYNKPEEALQAIVAAWSKAQVARSQDPALQLLGGK